MSGRGRTPKTPDVPEAVKSGAACKRVFKKKEENEETDRNTEAEVRKPGAKASRGRKADTTEPELRSPTANHLERKGVPKTPTKRGDSLNDDLNGVLPKSDPVRKRGSQKKEENVSTDSTQPEPYPTCNSANRGEEKRLPKKTTKRGDSLNDDLNKILLATIEKLKIKKNERSECTRCVNEVQEEVTKYLKKSLDWCKDIKVLRTGSHYENVKICEPDEFDVMLTVRVERVNLQPFGEDGAFYSVALKRLPLKHPLNTFLNEDHTIRASEMLNEFRDKVKEIAPKLQYKVKVERKKKGCPAVTLLVEVNRRVISLDFVLGLEVHTSWPDVTKNGFNIENWLSKKVKQDLMKTEPFYLVAKYEGNGNTEHDGVVARDTWRISFSNVEKNILKNHGKSKTCCETQTGTGCCRKQCLKLLKYLLQRLKEEHPNEISKFCSYHAKTTLLHACSSRVEDSHWQISQLHNCFQQLLDDFVRHLRSRQLSNFFIPSHNLLNSNGLTNKSCDFLASCIEYQLNNGFPVFR